MKLIAIVLPAIYFFITFRWIRAIVALVLMCTGIGWIFASLWALSVESEAAIDRKYKKLDRKLSQVAATTLSQF